MTTYHVVTFKLDPLLTRILEGILVATFDELKQAISDLKDEVAAETTQGADLAKRLTDLETQTTGGLTAAQTDELKADLDGLKGQIGGIVADQPAGGATPAPEPPANPTTPPDQGTTPPDQNPPDQIPPDQTLTA